MKEYKNDRPTCLDYQFGQSSTLRVDLVNDMHLEFGYDIEEILHRQGRMSIRDIQLMKPF